MNHYLDIRILPDPEFSQPILLKALFGKLHRGLVTQGEGKIGLSFPEHTATRLGSWLRLHASEEKLLAFMASDWLTGMRDHCQLGNILAVPAGVQYRVVRRVQSKSNPERLRRRAHQRAIAKGIDPSEIANKISEGKKLTLPSVEMQSRSSGKTFFLFIEHGPLQDQPIEGEFSCYGLSATATIPWF
jgi:CRISPR-associated endonuclease Csy4